MSTYRPGVITNENKTIVEKQKVPTIYWGDEYLSDNEQDTLRYTEDIAELAELIVNRIDKGRPIFKADWKEFTSTIRAFNIVYNQLQEELKDLEVQS